MLQKAKLRLELDASNRLAGLGTVPTAEWLADRAEYIEYLWTLPPCSCLSCQLYRGRSPVDYGGLSWQSRRAEVRRIVTDDSNALSLRNDSTLASLRSPLRFGCPLRLMLRTPREEIDARFWAAPPEGVGLREWVVDGSWEKIRRCVVPGDLHVDVHGYVIPKALLAKRGVVT